MLRFLAAFAIAASLIPHNRQSSDFAGTWAIWICPEKCAADDTARAAVVTGILVLADSAVPVELFPDSVRHHVGFLSHIGATSGRPHNACFSLRRRSFGGPVLAGMVPIGVSRWQVTTDSVAVAVFSGVDAASTILAVAQGGALHGEVHEVGDLRTPPQSREGHLVGVRVGPANPNRCMQAP